MLALLERGCRVSPAVADAMMLLTRICCWLTAVMLLLMGVFWCVLPEDTDPALRADLTGSSLALELVCASLGALGLGKFNQVGAHRWARLQRELYRARANRRDRSLWQSYCEKHYVAIQRRRDEIQAAWRREHADHGWIQFLERQGGRHGGHEVLAFYREDVDLLALADEIESAIPWDEVVRRRAQQALIDTETRILGETNIALEQRRLQLEAHHGHSEGRLQQ